MRRRAEGRRRTHRHTQADIDAGLTMSTEEEEEEEEEEGLFKADAVNEEDPERDRAEEETNDWRGTRLCSLFFAINLRSWRLHASPSQDRREGGCRVAANENEEGGSEGERERERKREKREREIERYR